MKAPGPKGGRVPPLRTAVSRVLGSGTPPTAPAGVPTCFLPIQALFLKNTCQCWCFCLDVWVFYSLLRLTTFHVFYFVAQLNFLTNQIQASSALWAALWLHMELKELWHTGWAKEAYSCSNGKYNNEKRRSCSAYHPVYEQKLEPFEPHFKSSRPLYKNTLSKCLRQT